jgi:hypothetical protein
MSATPGLFDPGGSRPHGAQAVAVEEHPVFLQHKHPNYVGIFVVLFIFTMLEVWVTTPILGIEFPLPVLTVPTLLVLAVLKFATIAAFYMHLRYDSRAFSALFIVGLLLAIGMLFTLQAIFVNHPRQPFDQEAARAAGQLPAAPGETAATPTAGAGSASTTTSTTR